MKEMNLSKTTVKIIDIFLEDPQAPRYGFELMKRIHRGAGTVYPILADLTSAGWLDRNREDAAALDRPPRIYYTLSAGAAAYLAARVIAMAGDSTAEHQAARAGIEPAPYRLGGGRSLP